MLHGVEINPLNQIDEDVDVIAGPDILVTGLKASSANVLPNTPASFYATLKNDGWNTTLGPDGTGWFGVDLYVKPAGSPPPNGPGDRYLGACPTPTNYCPNAIRWDYYRVAKFYTTTVGAGGLAPGETWQLTYTLPITPAGTYWLYVQADTYWGEPSTTTYGTPLHGRIKEGIESNNIFGPIEIEVGYQHLYLPLIFKQFP